MPRTDVVVIVRSSMKALNGGCCMPDFVTHSTSADLTTMFMARVNRITELCILLLFPSLADAS